MAHIKGFTVCLALLQKRELGSVVRTIASESSDSHRQTIKLRNRAVHPQTRTTLSFVAAGNTARRRLNRSVRRQDAEASALGSHQQEQADKPTEEHDNLRVLLHHFRLVAVARDGPGNEPDDEDRDQAQRDQPAHNRQHSEGCLRHG